MGLEGIPVGLLTAAIGLLGGNGLILIFWYVDHRRLDRQYLEHNLECARYHERIQEMRDDHNSVMKTVLEQYKDDVHTVSTFYQDNVILVKNYEKLASELMRVIELNIQIMTQHSDYIKNNMFCPLVREKGPRG